MTIFTSQTANDTPSRFRIRVNGLADKSLFPTLHQGENFLPARGGGGLRTPPKSEDSRSNPGAFTVRVDGHPTGWFFASLSEAIGSMALRPNTEDYDVFENEDRVFVKSHPLNVRLVEAL
jgi:hypothetical protein